MDSAIHPDRLAYAYSMDNDLCNVLQPDIIFYPYHVWGVTHNLTRLCKRVPGTPPFYHQTKLALSVHIAFISSVQNSAAAILRARTYLEGQYSSLKKPYSMALTAYALSLVDSPMKISANNRLIQHAIFDKGNYVNTLPEGQTLLVCSNLSFQWITT